MSLLVAEIPERSRPDHLLLKALRAEISVRVNLLGLSLLARLG
jgi:hypothetical protein